MKYRENEVFFSPKDVVAGLIYQFSKKTVVAIGGHSQGEKVVFYNRHARLDDKYVEKAGKR